MSRTDRTATPDRLEWDGPPLARSACARRAASSAPSPDVEDAAQEATIRAWRSRASCRAADRREAWLATIARREALRFTAARKTVPLENGPTRRTVAREPMRSSASSCARRSPAWLPRERSLVFARYWTDLTQVQLARALGLPEGTAKVRLHRARAQLRRSSRPVTPARTPAPPASTIRASSRRWRIRCA